MNCCLQIYYNRKEAKITLKWKIHRELIQTMPKMPFKNNAYKNLK